MNVEFANNLINNRPLELRWCKTIPNRGNKKIDCLLISHDGEKALLKRVDGKKDISVLLSDVEYR